MLYAQMRKNMHRGREKKEAKQKSEESTLSEVKDTKVNTAILEGF